MNTERTLPTRDELATRYLEQLPYAPYRVQEEALLAWFTSEQGVLVCAPTGMGKTLIAEAALYEALHAGRMAYYTTPLIALTEQKFQEMQAAAVRWGFHPDDVGLVTGNRRVNPNARVLVVVAEILLNRLLHPEAFDFADVAAVVMDEFHSFADPERGIVWELALGLLPPHVRLLLLSATVGNAVEFVIWLRQAHDRKIELVQGTERKVPLFYDWVADKLLNELIEDMAQGDDETRKTPALLFCFNREECWNVAEQLKGMALLADGQQRRLAEELAAHDWSRGAGPKLKQILMRGVGVHHAGLLPRYRRIVEELFQRKLLSVCVCTETLSAGINLPARSVVLTSLVKGPPDDKKLVEASVAQQIFGRAGRPQYDAYGFVYALAHEDDVKILRWRQKYDQIPEDTKDPGLLRARKDLKRKMPTRRSTETYWTEAQFEKLRTAPPGKLTSRGPLPWRLLAYMLKLSPEVDCIRALVNKRLMDSRRLAASQKGLDRMLLALWGAGYVTLEPPPPPKPTAPPSSEPSSSSAAAPSPAPPSGGSPFAALLSAKQAPQAAAGSKDSSSRGASNEGDESAGGPSGWSPRLAHAAPALDRLLSLRSVNPLYGVYIVDQMAIADRDERIQAMESVLELPSSMRYALRVPPPHDLPAGPLAVTRLDPLLLQRGLATAEELGAAPPQDDEGPDRRDPRDRPRILRLAEKLRLLFDFDYPGIHSLNTHPVWAVGELLRFGGDFNKYITSNQLAKQEGIVFRHLLRFILLCGELAAIPPAEVDADLWRAEIGELANLVTESCRQIDPTSTDKILDDARAAPDVVEGERGG